MNILKAIGDFNVNKVNNRREEATAHRVNTLIGENTEFAVREAYNAARTNIIYSLGGEAGGKKIIITSASPHEGKTTTCINLAITFAQLDKKVIVIDGDLRKPRIYRHLSIERENGLSDLLCGLADLDAVIKHCPEHKVDCITSGHIPPNPAELLASKEMAGVLDKLAQRYDYIFIDTPPVTVVTEAAAMAEAASGVILVVRQNNTIHESIQRARDCLKMANAKILGYILNDIDPASYGYGAYGKYGRYGYRSKRYSYSYGYGYGNSYGGYSYGYDDGYGYGYKERRRAEKTNNAEESGKKEKKLPFKKDTKKK